MKLRWQRLLPVGAVVAIMAAGAGVAWTASEEDHGSDVGMNAGVNCTFQADPDTYLAREASVREWIVDGANEYKAAGKAVAASSLPRRNFVDDEIFSNLEAKGIPAAQIADDHEYVRRVYLDLTGRVPTPDQVRSFVSDRAADKREALVRDLVYTEAFVNRWMMFLGEWLGMATSNTNNTIAVEGRNAFYRAVKERLADETYTLDRLAWETVASGGNGWVPEQGLSNFIALGRMPGGPGGNTPVDEWDAEFVRTASTFLGMGHYDCILCHNGRGHLDQVSLWGRNATRLQAWGMSAFFSKTEVRNVNPGTGNRWVVTQNLTGPYALLDRTTNRPPRTPITLANGTRMTTVQPAYRTGGAVQGSNWRASFADYMIRDRMFARNIANRIWKELFGMGLVEPIDTLDPARLDPKNPPQMEEFSLQASDPELLEKLADELIRQRFDLRRFVMFLTDSTTYQLSSRYDGPWNVTLAASFARHLPRRLFAEEIFDSISTATGTVDNNFLYVRGWSERLRYAVGVPDFSEPNGTGPTSTNGQANGFMNAFIRGNRDTIPASRDGSVVMQLALMNNAFVQNRIRTANSARLRQVAAITDDARLIDEMWISFLGRPAEAREADVARGILRAAPSRNAGVEDLSWVLINKLEFLYSH